MNACSRTGRSSTLCTNSNRRGRGAGRGGRDSVHAGQRRPGFCQDVENPVHNLRRIRLDDHAASLRSHEEGAAVRAGQPVGFAEAGKLIDDRRTVLLPRPDGIDRARILDLTSSSNQRIEPIQRDVAVGSQVVVHQDLESDACCSSSAI